MVQVLPSVQGAVFGVLWQPVAAAQESLVQGFWSSQFRGRPKQLPPLHLSSEVQALPSSQVVPSLGRWAQPAAPHTS